MRCNAERLLFLATLFVYGYFFQGGGFNQNAHFDTVRAIVERGSFEITEYATVLWTPGYTGDVSTVGSRVYSSKSPGLALLCAPFYGLVYAIERACGVDFAAPDVVRINQWLTTIWGAALPGAILAVVVMRRLRLCPMTAGDPLILAAGFAFGSLFFPYAGMLMVHSLVALCLFVAWVLVDNTPTALRASIAGLLIGVAFFADISAAPLVPCYLLFLWFRRRGAIALFLIGPILAAIATLLYQHIIFGHPLEAATSRVNVEYVGESLLFGHFDWPDLRRLWWLSFHPLRGLFYCCPIFVLALLSIRLVRPTLYWLIPAAVIVNFVLFNLTFHAWTAGWGTGPRYLIPILPFLIVLAARGYQRFRVIGYILITISVIAMFAVTAVRVQWPAKLYEPPYGDNAVAESIKRLTMRQIALDNDMNNLGLAVGLPKMWSIVPPALVIVSVFVIAARSRLRDRRPALRADAADVPPQVVST